MDSTLVTLLCLLAVSNRVLIWRDRKRDLLIGIGGDINAYVEFTGIRGDFWITPSDMFLVHSGEIVLICLGPCRT